MIYINKENEFEVNFIKKLSQVSEKEHERVFEILKHIDTAWNDKVLVKLSENKVSLDVTVILSNNEPVVWSFNEKEYLHYKLLSRILLGL